MLFYLTFCGLAAIGGLFGLGFGFSFISAIEILYFFLVRWFFAKLNKDSQDNGKIITNVGTNTVGKHENGK